MKNALSLFVTIILFWSLVSANSHAESEVSPMTVDGATTVTTEEAKKLFDEGVLFIDVRKDKDWAAGRVADAVQLNIKTVLSEQTMLSEMKKTDPTVIYCNGERCMRSSDASKKAVSWGFSNVYYYRDGFPAWKSAGYPIE